MPGTVVRKAFEEVKRKMKRGEEDLDDDGVCDARKCINGP